MNLFRTDPELKRISQMYEENYRYLFATVGSPIHRHYVAVERKLNQMTDQRMRELKGNSYMQQSICPINSPRQCENCTGYIKRRTTNSRMYKMAQPGEGTLCPIKGVMLGRVSTERVKGIYHSHAKEAHATEKTTNLHNLR